MSNNIDLLILYFYVLYNSALDKDKSVNTKRCPYTKLISEAIIRGLNKQ